MLPWVRKRATQLEANKQHTCIWIAYKTLYSRCFFFFFLGIKVLCFQGSLTNAQGFSAPKALSGIPLPLSVCVCILMSQVSIRNTFPVMRTVVMVMTNIYQ